MSASFAGCIYCTSYARRRGPVVFKAIAASAIEQGMDPAVKAADFFSGVHKRHTSGKAI